MHVTNPTTQAARKFHRCYWCGGPICEGEFYDRWACFDGGDISVVKVHQDCHRAWNTLSPPDFDEVNRGDYARGCTCEHGRCECPKP